MLRHPYWPALDGLRALAVMAVMLFHAHGPALPGGFLGVDVFFVISGFLIASQLQGEYQQTGRIRVVAFFMRRLVRLQPALWAVLLFDLTLNLLGLNPWHNPSWWKESLSAWLAMANWARAFQWQALELMGHTWSLGIEEQFYIGWVLLWVVLQKSQMPLVRQQALVLLMALASALTMAWLYKQGANVGRLYNGTDTRIQAPLLGCALALWRAQQIAHAAQGALSAWRPMWMIKMSINPAVYKLKQWLGLMAMGGLVIMALTIDWRAPAMYLGGYTLLALLSVWVVADLTGSAPGLLSRCLAWGCLPHLGKISYGLYLWHYPLYRLAIYGAEMKAPGQWQVQLACLLGATVLTWALAEISERWLERPLREAFKRHFQMHIKALK